MNTKVLPMLYGVSRTSKVKQWQARVEEQDDRTAMIIVESGYVGGKIRESPKLIKKGKNIGKSNETTPYEQAVSEIESKWTAKRYENYELELLDPNNYIPRLMLPQLAKGPGAGKIVYPAYIEPKLNGVCNIAEPPMVPPYFSSSPDLIQHHTKGGHFFNTLAHLDKWIHKLNAPASLHGELYVHGWSLQKIGSYTKKIKSDQHLLEYWLYDIAWLNIPFDTRIEWLEETISLITKNFPECPLKFTPTEIVNNYAEAKVYHDKCVADGFEGAMLKNKNGMYMFQYRSNEIEKVKDYKTEEFEIVGGKEGNGTDEGCIVYRCITEGGLEFDARPRGTVADRREMFSNLSNDVGKMLTVRFAEFSDEGVPLQPVGVPEAEVVRDYE